ncbi:MAG: hypothetical protein M3004_02420 [Bacteroidota bacterium]|nr:hypothetical protein [Bacteroidota bacterium]
MGYSDFLLFPFYLLLFAFIFSRLRKNYKDPLLKKYHKQGFWIKVWGCIAFTIFNVYVSPGDSLGLYHQEGVNIFHLILHDPSNIQLLFMKGANFDESLLKDPGNAGYFKADNNFLVTKLVTIFSFITFGKYFVINLIFALIAFTGAWKLFLFFYEQYPQHHKKFAIAVLYLPTFVFWSSGILKDTLCIAGLGWITYAIYEVLYRKRNYFKNIILLSLFGTLIMILKVYILISYVPFFVLYIILKNMEGMNNKFFKYMLAPVIISLTIFGFLKVLNTFDEQLEQFAPKGLTKSIKRYNTGYANQAGSATSNFSLGTEFDGSAKGLLKLAPLAVTATLFRPYLWESHKFSTLLSSIESFLMMLFTIYMVFKSGIRSFFKYIIRDPLIMYCFLFSIVFALFVGASTLNFGSLVRYKIPCTPFYLIALFLIYERVKARAALKLGMQKTIADDVIFKDPQSIPQLSLS